MERTRQRSLRLLLSAGATAALLLAVGCGHHKKPAYTPPPQANCPVTPAPRGDSESYPQSPTTGARGRIAPTPAPPGGVDASDLDYIATHEPVRSLEGIATWYRAPYKGRRAANGQVFDDSALTVAHRTLPMGTLIVVTNLKNGKSSAMRVTDRGPFAPGIILDMTEASAKATGLWPSSGRVHVDVYKAPKPIDSGGRWCVQFGPLAAEESATQLKAKLQRSYPDASVIQFPGDKSFWVRIRPGGDNREQAEYISRHTVMAEGAAYLTRLD